MKNCNNKSNLHLLFYFRITNLRRNSSWSNSRRRTPKSWTMKTCWALLISRYFLNSELNHILYWNKVAGFETKVLVKTTLERHLKLIFKNMRFFRHFSLDLFSKFNPGTFGICILLTNQRKKVISTFINNLFSLLERNTFNSTSHANDFLIHIESLLFFSICRTRSTSRTRRSMSSRPSSEFGTRKLLT